MTAARKKIFSYLVKATILLLAAWFIYHKFIDKGKEIHDFGRLIQSISTLKVSLMMAFVVLLMLLNWLLEALKWRYVTRKLAFITVWQAIECVFCGLTWAASTPNRIGEYGGRVMFLPHRKRVHGIFAMIVAGIGQNAITNILGLSASLWFIYTFLPVGIWLYLLICLLSVCFIAFTLVFYFHIGWLVNWLYRFKFIYKYHRFFDIMARYKSSELINILCFGLGRYIVFSFQYYLLLHLLIPELPVIQMMLLLFIMFFVQSAVPSLDWLDIGVRSSVATILFAYITTQQLSVVAVVSTVYIINIIIPAILGSVFVFKLKFFDRTV